MRRAVALSAVLFLGASLLLAVNLYLPPFGSFPERGLGGFEGRSIGQHILEEAPRATGSANIVTSVVWDYRAYDTLGEATVLFTAVCGVVMLFRALGRRGR
jgi:multicomponent Na+:H+ antiporter subunit B